MVETRICNTCGTSIHYNMDTKEGQIGLTCWVKSGMCPECEDKALSYSYQDEKEIQLKRIADYLEGILEIMKDVLDNGLPNYTVFNKRKEK